MPSKSASQHRLMEAAAHTKGGYHGVSEAVGKDFVAADKKKKSKTHTAVAHELGMHKK